MKKLLLSFVALFACIALSAATFNWADVFGDQTKDISTWTSGDFTFTASKGTGATNPAYNKAGEIRLYAANTLTITAKSAMTKIVFTLAANDARYTSITASTGSVSAQAAGDTEVTWTGNATEVTFTVKEGATAFGTEEGKMGQFRFSAMDITGGGEAGTIVTPEPTPAEQVENIAAWLTKADATNSVAIKNSLTAVYQNGSSLYVKDNSGWLLVYGSVGQTYNNGDVIPGGAEGIFAEFSGLPEMKTPKNFAAGTPGTPVEPEEIIADDLNATPLSAYVKLTGVTIEESADGKTYNATDGSADFVIYNTFTKTVTVTTGEDLTVYGFVSIHGDAYQVTPILVETASGVKTVATPYFSPAAGEVAEGTVVTITCSTPDAKIYYTLDGTEPTEASALYTDGITVNEAVTIKAIATLAGWNNSAVATAAYTIKEPVNLGDAVVFKAPDCADVDGISLINKDGSTTASANNDESVSLTGETFAGDNVDITFVQGEGVNFYTGAYGDAVRWMQGNIIEVKPAAGHKVTKIFVQTAANSKGVFEVTVDGTVTGTITGEGTGVANPITWTGDAEGTLVLTSVKQVRFKYMAITLADSGSVDAIAADDANAPVEYYNLQGVRVAEPSNGLYIRRQGNTVTKVIL